MDRQTQFQEWGAPDKRGTEDNSQINFFLSQ